MVNQMTEYDYCLFLAKQLLSTQPTEELKMTCGFIVHIMFVVT